MSKTSFVDYSPDCDFPIENLPYGVFSTKDDGTPRIGVAIGDLILDLKKSNGVFQGPLLKGKTDVFKQTTLNDFMALGKPYWIEARQSLQSYLAKENSSNRNKGVFVPQSEAKMHLPAQIGDYSDFFSSYYHAYNCSLMFNMAILKSNWRHIPIAYHGRSSSICISGTPVKRPVGQIIENPAQPEPTLQPTKRLDFELEVGVFLGGPLNKLGTTMDIDTVQDNIFGVVILNDWSARDVQLWEMVPLGPFLAKNFASTISPWIVTMEALQPFLTENMKQDPVPLPYLRHEDNYNFDIVLEAHLKTDTSLTKLSQSNYKYLYWTAKQQLCHHAITGCNMRPGDLLGSGTISGPTKDSVGCLMELTFNARDPVTLTDGKHRTFLEDGDEVILSGYCQGQGYRVGFGKCSGKILPSDYPL
ncbi:fumarylacetoacetase [Planococcus citri]|uniref:fumarylacetoacetase n=1 Tax=Planococcus citri TaxID=170843 RepID=UPI0031F818E4